MTLTTIERLVLAFLYRNPKDNFTIAEVMAQLSLNLADCSKVEYRLKTHCLIFERDVCQDRSSIYCISEYGKIFYQNRFA